MKLQSSINTFMALAMVMVFSAATLHAEEAPPPAGTHDQHHPEGQAKEMPKDNGMMGSMKMDDMMGMMHECMEMHKDGKMCNHEAMNKCQEKMGKSECKKMMKQAKAKQKTEKKTK